MEEKRRDSTDTQPPPSAATEAPNSEQPTSRRRGGGQKRKLASLNSGGGSSNSQTTSKRQAREKPHVVPFPTIHMNGPCTRARVQPNSSNNFSPAEVPVKREAEVREAAAKAEELSRVNENWEALEAKIEAEYEAIRSRDANVHVVPVHAGWFSWAKIHSLEKRMLPSFFSRKLENKTPEMYMEIRNWIMKKFHLNPSEQIELKDLSELTVGKLEDRQEVMEFLDYWGLINYHPFPKSGPASMSADSYAGAGAGAGADETQKPDSLIEKLFQFETEQSWTPMVPRMSTSVPATSSGLFPESVIADELVKSEGPSVEYHCNSCAADCSRKRYHCQKQADFDLCAECFNNGKFDADMSPSDFILMEPAEAGGVSGGNWTDQETILLLEAIEIFKDNWSEIAEHVATKTKAQCILHFVQMPIEDAFLGRDNENNAAHEENGLPVSIITEDSAPKANKDRDTALKDVPEKSESQGDVTHNKASSGPMEISKQDDVNESNKCVEVREDFALKALKEAFEAVGASPLPGEKFSFAEAGNPVMTLAAFLVRLVEPNIATASVRSLLKSLSTDQTSEHLAARHCFRLEDPPVEKNLNDSEKAATETIDHDEAQKLEVGHVENKNEETPDGISLRDDVNDENKDSAPVEHTEKSDSASEGKKAEASPNSGLADNSDTVKEPDGMATHEEAELASMNEPQNSDVPKELTPKDAEESVILASNAELQSNSMKESEDGALAEENSRSKEPLKDEEIISNSGKTGAELLIMSDSMKENVTNTDDTKAEACGTENKETLVTENDDFNKLKRAAVTTLSAAALKAKLLADQEEDEIRQLATMLIEKQLHKLETKLAFFNDMENVVMRVKEQLDRSKQRLFQERAQIIATRFGMSASARPTSQSLPLNRAAAINFPNSASRPFMGMNSIRPPISRASMAPNPTSSSFVPPNAAGNSVQPNADKPFSVGTK
ncbi:hypothetical protein ACJIZ3_000870 [Penstemon smallii]|uniref:SWI/SNF complex subunit SWI3D n=1 Tax=Penstemon smallii TaxID=265156 RepID=A0ABD3U237_9LAMI